MAGLPFFVYAAGNISGYAWAENAGWINFGCPNCTATVSDSALTGYAWSDNYGWINLSPSTGGGVANDGAGNLSGNAWSQNAGWIDFGKAPHQVFISTSTGAFSGSANGDITGLVLFSCANCNVSTTWRPSGGNAPITTYTLTYTAGANGSITGISPQTVNQGANGTAVTAVSASGYHFVNWSDNSTSNPRTDTNVQANISVTANFAITPANNPPAGGGAVAVVSQPAQTDNSALIAKLEAQIQDLIQQIAQVRAQILGGANTISFGEGAGACAGIKFVRNIKMGSYGQDVKCLQVILNRNPDTQVAISGAGSPGFETMLFGAKTLSAVRTYQSLNGLIPGFQVGPLTRLLLNMDLDGTGDQNQ